MTYLQDLADEIEAEALPAGTPDAQMRDLFRVYAVLAQAKGEETTARDVHDAWVAWMLSLGRDHESMVPYSELPPEVQREDDRFVSAIREVVCRRRAGQ